MSWEILQGPSFCVKTDLDGNQYEDWDGVPNTAQRAIYWRDNTGLEWGNAVTYNIFEDEPSTDKDIDEIDRILLHSYAGWLREYPELIPEEE